MTTARRIAAEVLLRVATGGAFANLALDSALRQAGVLEPREAALATELVYGTLRWQPQLDRALMAHSDRALEELDEPVRLALRIGAFELLHHQKVPAHAAVNEAVELAKTLGFSRASGFVNAVLRKLSEVRAPPPPPSRETDPVGHVAALTAHPRWIVERWSRWLGPSEAEQLCAANQQQAPATVRVKRGAKPNLPGAQRGRWSPDALILPPGSPPALDIEGHEEGLFQAQDEAAQMVSIFCAPAADASVLDACAAPGGKACHLAEMARSVLAVDLHARKARQIAEAAARMGLGNLRALAADVMLPIPDVPFESFDLVLLDGADLLADAREVAGEQGRRDQHVGHAVLLRRAAKKPSVPVRCGRVRRKSRSRQSAGKPAGGRSMRNWGNEARNRCTCSSHSSGVRVQSA